MKELKRLAIRAADVACVAYLDSRDDRALNLVKTLVYPGFAKSERLRAGMHLVGTVIPSFEENCTRFLLSIDRFPVEENSGVKLIGYGGEQTVFLVEVNGVKRVFKVNRDSLGLPTEELYRKVSQIKQEYLVIRSCYSTIPEFIPDEEFLVTHGHLLRMSAVVTVQPYIEGEIRCLFGDYSEAELLILMKLSPGLSRQFMSFASRFLADHQRNNRCIDVLGERNLSVVTKEGVPRLMLLDPHVIYDSELLAQRPAETRLRLQQRIDYIEKIFLQKSNTRR